MVFAFSDCPCPDDVPAPPAISGQENWDEFEDREALAPEPTYVNANIKFLSCDAIRAMSGGAAMEHRSIRHKAPIEQKPHRVGSGIFVALFADRSDSGEF